MNIGLCPVETPLRNHLLVALAPDDMERLRPQLSRAVLVMGQILHERGDRIEDVFFMEEGVASLTADQGHSVLP